MSLGFTGERIVPGSVDCDPTFAQKMYQEHLARYAFAAQLANGADVLDVGCGVGYGSQWLAKSGARTVVGIDVAEDAIEHARLNYFHPAVTYKAQDATVIDRAASYDLVTCFELIEHIEKQETLLDLIKSSLRENGILAISTPRPLDEIRTHFHVHEMNFEELFGLLKKRFKYVESFFEINCFTSFVGNDISKEIDHVVPVTNKIGLDYADYFIFLASDAPIDQRSAVRPVLTLNDDSYVLTLEKDVSALRNAENYHLACISDLQKEKDDLFHAHGEASQRAQAFATINDQAIAIRSTVDKINLQMAAQFAEAQGLRDRIRDLDTEAASKNFRIAELANEVENLRTQCESAAQPEAIATLERQLSTSSIEIEEVRRLLAVAQGRQAEIESSSYVRIASMEASLQAAVRDAGQLGDDLARRETELGAVRRALSDASQQLAEAQTDALSHRQDAERLPGALQHAAQFEAEANSLRYQLNYAEATLARFRTSFSWALTRPIRWVWRKYRKLTGRSLPL